MSRTSRWWTIFAACNVIVALALIWTTRVVVDLERSELRARSETGYQESLRLAMWRMDSWLAMLLAREAARPESGEEDYVQFRFEISAVGEISSAQPEQLLAFRQYLAPENIRRAMEHADRLVSTQLAPPTDQAPSITDVDWSQSQALKTQNEFDARVACSVPRPPGSKAAGRQVVVWLAAPAPITASALTFLRRNGEGDSYSGYILDWRRIETRLLFEIRDLFPDASLDPVLLAEPVEEPLGRGLANIPVTLVTPPPTPVQAARLSGGRAALGVAWLAAIIAAIAVGITLRNSIELGERRRRFVSAVTHELRTPLTTFQLYSEMLADGIVQDERQRQEYLQTLKDESQRLSTMVSNVLSHARIEEDHGPRHLEQTTLGELVARLLPPLERRVASSNLDLEVVTQSPEATPLAVDPDAVGQIVGNLIDNAAKYADGSNPSTIRLAGSTTNGSLILTVRDYGPGVPRRQAKAIFAPFNRGDRGPTDQAPGVGLGLALSRSLARDMGGDLTLEMPGGGGALFRLVVPNPTLQSPSDG